MNEFLPFLTNDLSRIIGDLYYFVPEIYLGLLFIVVLLADLIVGKNSERICRAIACVGLVLVAFKLIDQMAEVIDIKLLFSGMLIRSRTSIIFRVIIDVTAMALLLYYKWDSRLAAHKKGLSDLYSITIASVLGLHLMVMACNMLSIYLAIEMVSLASYFLVAYRTESAFSSEAGLKYVLFGAAASAMMLYGISLLYGFTGTLDIFATKFTANLAMANTTAVTFALILVLIGIGFKLSFVPIHFWVPDVYEGAPTPITAYLSTVPKVAAFGLLINFLTPFTLYQNWHSFDFGLCLSVIGIITMIVGNFAAVMQKNVKRMLAYSSIGHTGFALMAIVTFSEQGIAALSFYLAAYIIANLGALSLVSYFSDITGSEDVESYKGLGVKHPVASLSFIIILISLTGLPVSAGFNGKLLVFSAVYSVYQSDHNIWLMLLTATGALTTVVALFYYIKVPLYLFLKRAETPASGTGSRSVLIFSAVAAALVLILGIFPALLADIL